MLVGRGLSEQVENIRHHSLEDLHLQTVGVKVWATEHGVRDVEVARLSCGGHGTCRVPPILSVGPTFDTHLTPALPAGNMAAAGLGSIYAQLSASRTYEGDNYVLSQQIGNAINKHWKRQVSYTPPVQKATTNVLTRRPRTTESSIPALSYLVRLRDGQKMHTPLQLAATTSGDDADSFLNPDIQEDILEHRAALLARRHISDTNAGRDTSYDVFELTMAHADLVYWRGLQGQTRHIPKEHEPAVGALVNLVSPHYLSLSLRRRRGQ